MQQDRPMATGIIEKLEDVTPTVLRAMSGADSARLRSVMEAFVRHMHAFAREVKLTEDEYDIGIDFLNRIGQATSDRHNEGILFADAIGLSKSAVQAAVRILARRRLIASRRATATTTPEYSVQRPWR